MYYVISLLTEDTHHGHLIGSGVAGFSQQMNKSGSKVSTDSW